ncbi:glycosyltransferase family A protein [Dolichospermum sp. UHCC 0259]|uniref:glycosyltransferase family 2 protein n=1 Tax=Dolichospermum sp. UHCC 0259 TaxID=2590010 RepID=UPI0014459B66|nr:glycosyltransferase family A protein [Dolichospermum sp. UHCC 0259]MTJ50064.1 glycosyltransferase family 2 protein [Dolichospermum sp. UHCC 0259]
MNNAHPKISVIVPIFNREAYLAETLESIVTQSVLPHEVIVVDDGSTDSGGEIARSFPSVRYHDQTNQGAAVARNQGIQLASGDFFAFLDSDDRWMADKLALQLTAFAANLNLEMVLGHVRQFYSPELDETARQKIQIPKEVMPGYHIGTMLIRREAFFRVGWLETNLKQGEFISWYLRARDAGLQIAMLPEVVMERRIHQTNLGRNSDLNGSDYVRILKASLDRRRASGKISSLPGDGEKPE